MSPRCRWFVALLFVVASTSRFVSADLLGEAPREKDPRRAIEQLLEDEKANPDRWEIPFAIAQKYKHTLKDCASALPHYERAMQKSAWKELRPIVEAGYCHSDTERNQRIITWFERYLATGGQVTGEKSLDLLARAYYRSGWPEKALRFAAPGSSIWKQAATKIIELDVSIQLAQNLRGIHAEKDNRIRITLPLERPYQRLLEFKVITKDERSPILAKDAGTIGENHYAELTRNGADWPDEVTLSVRVEQKIESQFQEGGPRLDPVTDPANPLFAAAHLNPQNEYSLETPEFRDMILRASDSQPDTSAKVRASLGFLRANFRYAERKVSRSAGALAVLRSGQGDCGFFSMLGMAILRVHQVPVRRVFGLNLRLAGTTHVIIEIYDARTGRWFPHDPIIPAYYGFINPMYVPFTTDEHIHGNKRVDGILHMSTPGLRWNGVQNERYTFVVRIGDQIVHSSSSPGDTADLEPAEKRPVIFVDD